jgi:biotin carboxylase
MSAASQSPGTVVCVASFFKGGDFIRECAERGARVVLVTRDKLLGEHWPREALADIVGVPSGSSLDVYLDLAEALARSGRVERVVALEEYDVLTAAVMREHLCLPGLGVTVARTFSDKLAMRVRGRSTGLLAPDFTALFRPEDAAEFLERVPPPWMLKPRWGASAMGVRRLESADAAWNALAELDAQPRRRDRPGGHLLEQLVPGTVFHVNALVDCGRVVFTSVLRYGSPPFDTAKHGGVSTSVTVENGSPEEVSLAALNERLLTTFGFDTGTTHAEFIESAADGRLYFLEVAARVGGAFTVETVEAATGVNLWSEWARLETATVERPYVAPPARRDHAGVAVCLARHEHPDTSSFDDPEIVDRVRIPYHVGLVVGSPEFARVVDLVGHYARRFEDEFAAVGPPEDRPDRYL